MSDAFIPFVVDLNSGADDAILHGEKITEFRVKMRKCIIQYNNISLYLL